MTPKDSPCEKTLRAIKITLVLAVLALISSGCIVNDCRTLASFKKVDDYPLYVMKYYGDYGVKDLQTGRGLNGIERWGMKKLLPQSNNPQCSCFAAMNPQSDPVFGRNFDWDTQAALLLFTDPSDGYASVSMVDITYFGFSRTKAGLLSRFALRYTPQLPFDGMNECGLAVGIMTIPRSNGGNDPNKESMGFMQLLRQMLDHAANVDEAVALAQKYNIVFTYSPTNHLLVSDAAGNSAVIEFLNGTPTVTRNTQPFQAATNFIIAGLDTEQAINSCWRYKKTWQTLQQVQGQLDPKQAMALLNNLSQPNSTIWSTVYGQSTGKIQLAMGRQYDEVYDFSLKMKNKDNTRTSVYPIPPANATCPNPADQSAMHPAAKPKLRWTAGANAKSHKVYFGEDKNNLPLLADTKKPEIQLPNIEKGKVYYWRVDEVPSDGTVVPGDIWSFRLGELVGFWKFDETDGRIASDSTDNNNAVLQGNAVFKPSAGHQGGAVYLDGDGDAVDIGNFSLTTGTITMAAWINGHRAKNWAGIIGSRNLSMTCGIYYGDDNRLHYTWNNDSSLTWDFNQGTALPQDQWAFVACTIESDKATLYVYTKEQGLKTAVNKIKHIPQTLNKLKFGWDTAQDTRHFTGLIDEVRIYDYALTKADIAKLCKEQ